MGWRSSAGLATLLAALGSCAAAPRRPTITLTREAGHGLPGLYSGSITAADLDGDRRIDLVLAGHFDTRFDSARHTERDAERLAARVRLYRNTSTRGGPITFELVEERADLRGWRGALVVRGDFDGDRRADLAVQMRLGAPVTTLLNRGGWRFDAIAIAGFSNNATSLGMVAVDVDRDGRDELAFASDGRGSGPGLWYRFDPKTSTWSVGQVGFSHAIDYGGAIAAGDLDGDGFADLAISGNARAPLGALTCTNLMYGHVFRNRARRRGPGVGFDPVPWASIGSFGAKVPAHARGVPSACLGMDNGGLAIADLDRDGRSDLVVAGSMTGLDGAPGANGQQYDVAVLYRRGRSFDVWEHAGPQDRDGTTNGGVGNVDLPNIALGDLDGDRRPELFVQGHRRDFALRWDVDGDGVDKDNPYVFEDLLFQNDGTSFTRVPLDAWLGVWDGALPEGLGFLAGRPRFVAEGGQVIADLNGDGKNDLVFSGALYPFHTNGVNARDLNDARTLVTYVLRNTTRR